MTNTPFRFVEHRRAGLRESDGSFVRCQPDESFWEIERLHLPDTPCRVAAYLHDTAMFTTFGNVVKRRPDGVLQVVRGTDGNLFTQWANRDVNDVLNQHHADLAAISGGTVPW